MRKLPVVVAAMLLVAAPAYGQGLKGKTRAGYIACLTLSDFNEQSELLASGDEAAWQEFLMDSSCISLKGGVVVYMQNAKGLGVIKIRPEGSTVWFYTYTEAFSRS